MDKVSFIEVDMLEGVVEHAIIDHGNDQFTSMPKAVYEEQQVEHLTEIVADETETK